MPSPRKWDSGERMHRTLKKWVSCIMAKTLRYTFDMALMSCLTWYWVHLMKVLEKPYSISSISHQPICQYWWKRFIQPCCNPQNWLMWQGNMRVSTSASIQNSMHSCPGQAACVGWGSGCVWYSWCDLAGCRVWIVVNLFSRVRMHC